LDLDGFRKNDGQYLYMRFGLILADGLWKLIEVDTDGISVDPAFLERREPAGVCWDLLRRALLNDVIVYGP
jgi:hypothetical protein